MKTQYPVQGSSQNAQIMVNGDAYGIFTKKSWISVNQEATVEFQWHPINR